MKFLAIRSDRQPTPEVWRKFVHKQNVTCFNCKLIYQLWVPLEVASDEAIKQQSMWLNKELPLLCPDHEDWFQTADLETGPAQA